MVSHVRPLSGPPPLTVKTNSKMLPPPVDVSRIPPPVDVSSGEVERLPPLSLSSPVSLPPALDRA